MGRWEPCAYSAGALTDACPAWSPAGKQELAVQRMNFKHGNLSITGQLDALLPEALQSQRGSSAAFILQLVQRER